MTDPNPNNRLPPALGPLIAENRWVVWRWETVKDKKTKVPYRATDPSRKAKTTDPTTWSDFATAVAAEAQTDGIGFCLKNSDIAAFDIDNCRDPETGALDPWAQALVERARSYTEITVSGTGLGSSGMEPVPRSIASSQCPTPMA